MKREPNKKADRKLDAIVCPIYEQQQQQQKTHKPTMGDEVLWTHLSTLADSLSIAIRTSPKESKNFVDS